MVKTNLPVLILKDMLFFPHNEIRLEFSQDKDKELISLALSYYNKHILVVHHQDNIEEALEFRELPRIGVIGYIEMKIDLPNKNTRIILKGLNRVNIEQYEKEDNLINAIISEIDQKPLDKIEEIAYARSLQKQIIYYIENNPSMSNSILSQISSITNIDKLTDILAQELPTTYDRKLNYLYEINPTNRATMIIEDINQELKVVELEQVINEKVNKNIELSQKEYFLKEKLKVIQEELKYTSLKEEEIKLLKTKINNLRCDKKVKDRLNLELNRYKSLPDNSPEIAVIRNYIDWLLSLPWKYSTKDNTDLVRVKKILDKTHYGLDEVKERILEFIALEQFTNKDNSPIICLVGPPGVGKTTLAKSIAQALNRKYAKISVGGVNDEAEIVGHRRTYIAASPGRIIQGIKKAGSNNPVFIIDEIDKMCKDIKGDPSSALLEILDKEQNKKFSDNYIEEEFDLSKVMFITTANYEYQIPPELYDRLEIIEISSYTEYEKLNIAKNYIIPKAILSHGLSTIKISFQEETILKIIRNYTKEAGIRQLERLINTIMRRIVKDIVITSKKESYIIEESDLYKYLGREKYQSNQLPFNNQVGVVNAMSYTIYGGDILKVEANYYKGKGNIITTGSLGKVFLESAMIALSYIKSNYQNFNINYDLIENSDIHIHVLEAAVKKEGPSAGAAVTLAIISALTKQPIPNDISLTGEITLHGDILRVGGIKEKVIGAKRKGIKKIYIPKDNREDIKELDEEIKKDLTFVYVTNFKDIYFNLNKRYIKVSRS